MHTKLAYGALLLATILFGYAAVWGKALFAVGLTPLQVTAFRIIVAGACMAALACLRGFKDYRIARGQVGFLCLFALLFTLVQFSFYVSASLTGVAIALTLQYTAPLFVALWERLHSGRRIGWRRFLAMLAALAGCAAIARVDDSAFLKANLAGILAGLAGGLIFAAYSLMGSAIQARGLSTRTAALYSFGLAALALLALLPFIAPAATSLTAETLGQLLLMGVGATFAPFLLLILALRRVGAFEATLMGTMEPVAGAFLAYAILGESLRVSQMAGMALVLIAVTSAAARPSPARRASLAA